MKEYTFFISGSYRTPHVKSKSVYSAWIQTKKQMQGKKMFKALIHADIYMISKKSGYMSEWKTSNDKRLKNKYITL